MFCCGSSNPIFQDNRHMTVAGLSALRTGRLNPPGNFPGTHFFLRVGYTFSRNPPPPPPRRSEWGSNLTPDCFVSRGSISHVCFVTKVFYGEELLALRPTPKLEDHPCRLSATAYSIYSRLPSYLEAVPPSATRGRAMLWWQGPTYHTTNILTTIITGNGCVTVIYAGSHKLPSFETIYVYIFTVEQNFRTKTGLGRRVFNWFCEAVCSDEFIPLFTYFTSEA
jgi:hypothetical protein